MGTNPKGTKRQSAIFCVLLRFSVVSFENQRFPAENLRFPHALFSRKRRESAKISENLRLVSVCSLRFVPLSSLTTSAFAYEMCGFKIGVRF